MLFLNRMAENFESECSEWMGTGKDFTIYNQLGCELTMPSGGSLEHFIEQLEYHERKQFKLFKKKYMTLSVYCPLVASIRNPRLAIQKLSKLNQVPEKFMNDDRGERRFITSCCQLMLAVCDTNDGNGSSVSIYSTVDNECLLKDFKISNDDDSNITITSLALTFHPFMHSEYRKTMKIDPKQLDANIYCLYVLYTSHGGDEISLKKYLICDTLQGELLVHEQYQMLSKTVLFLQGQIPTLSVCGWEQSGIDLVVINTATSMYLCTPEGIVFTLYNDIANNPFQSTTIEGHYLNVPNDIQSSYLLNYSKVLTMRGYSLRDSTKFSTYSLFSLQFGGQFNSRDSKLCTHFIYLAIAKKKPAAFGGGGGPTNTTQSTTAVSPYSIFVHDCPQYSNGVELKCYDHDSMELRQQTQQTLLSYGNLGREVNTEISYYVMNELAHRHADDFYERHWENVYSQYYDFVTKRDTYQIWDCLEFSKSPGVSPLF